MAGPERGAIGIDQLQRLRAGHRRMHERAAHLDGGWDALAGGQWLPVRSNLDDPQPGLGQPTGGEHLLEDEQETLGPMQAGVHSGLQDVVRLVSAGPGLPLLGTRHGHPRCHCARHRPNAAVRRGSQPQTEACPCAGGAPERGQQQRCCRHRQPIDPCAQGRGGGRIPEHTHVHPHGGGACDSDRRALLLQQEVQVGDSGTVKVQS
mmetsp:Transcript_129615/g.223984  ORF Transcript_129615/g.223984 Transcript_129615/m.223984 type:complete len:206 (+) Transcript_129615:496-1113(+)